MSTSPDAVTLAVHNDGTYDLEYDGIARAAVPELLRDIADQMEDGAAIETDEDGHVIE